MLIFLFHVFEGICLVEGFRCGCMVRHGEVPPLVGGHGWVSVWWAALQGLLELSFPNCSSLL